MTISFLVNEVRDGWSPYDTRLGGTEESVVEWSKRLKLKGQDVVVYQNGFVGEYEGVRYKPQSEYKPQGVTINVKNSLVPPQEQTWYLTNEVDAGKLDLHEFTGVILPSKWALDNLRVYHSNIQILAHGYDQTKIFPHPKMPFTCLYASSPDRGLDELRSLWPQVVEQVPEAQLFVTYGGYLDTPNTICLGDVDSETMNQLFNTTQFWIHPCTGGELYCISAIKAQAAQAIPIYYPTMALTETVRWGVRVHQDTLVRKLVNAMTDESYRREIIARLSMEEYPNWDTTTDHLLKILNIKRFASNTHSFNNDSKEYSHGETYERETEKVT